MLLVVRSPVIVTSSPKKASSSTCKSPFVVIVSVVASPRVKLPETLKFPETVKSFLMFTVVPSNVKFYSAVKVPSP